MPTPVFFDLGEREVSVTQDEAREILARLPAGTLGSEIMRRVEGDATSPIHLAAAGDAEGSLVALRNVIGLIEDEQTLSPAMKRLLRLTVTALEGGPPGLRLA